MPVTVPDEPKKYTTVYENFKGVDFTNDPSNVYKRRSPGGKNMLPDLDGRPYKRKGWKIEYSAQDFITAAGSQATEVVPKRIHHFSMNGMEYMVMFNSLGVFYTNEKMNSVVKCQLASYDANEQIVTEAFPPLVDGNSLEADSGRTFFFESNGVAGLYTFVGMALFRFDGQYYWRVEPYVPDFLIACEPDGTGTLLDNINLLTTKRRVSYKCDGKNTEFIVPSGIDTSKEAVVEIMNPAGGWDTAVWNTDVTYSNGVLTFTTAPEEVVTGEDCMRVTYHPSNLSTYVKTQTLTATAYKHERFLRYERCYCEPALAGEKPATHYGEFIKDDDFSYTYTDASYMLTDPKNASEVTITPSGGAKTHNAYNNTVTYRPPDSAYVAPQVLQNEGIERSTVTVYAHYDYNTLSSAIRNKRYDEMWLIGTFGVDGSTASYVDIRNQFQQYTAETSGYAGYYYVYEFFETRHIKKDYTAECTLEYEQFGYATLDDENTIADDKTAFTNCKRATVFGSGLINQVFVGASVSNGYSSRLWYSGVGRPEYFPDINYVEVGSNDTRIMGMMKCDEYLGIIKAGNALDSSIYMAFPTSFGDDTTYAVKQSIAGVGALSMGAFNIISDESVFLSPEGVMAIEFGEENRLRNRSYFVDKRLCAEPNLSDAISYVFNNMYYLSVNNHCYVLDGSQKNSWVNEKTNLQYECYYLDNVPAQCFADMGGYLWFTDYDGNLCRFKNGFDTNPYRDEYVVGHATIDADDMNVTELDGAEINIGDLIYTDGGSTHVYTKDELAVGMVVKFYSSGEYSITQVTDSTVILNKGVPVYAIWDTIADDDGAIQFFKNLNKKGFVVSLLPGSSSGVKVSFKPDEKPVVPYGVTDASGNLLPYDYFVRKKIKKYKRLQIICENGGLDQCFGIDQILKTYTVGNYSKNRK